MSKRQLVNEKGNSVRSLSVNTYRTQWPRIGAVLAPVVGGISILGARKMSKPRLLALLNFGALLLHQFEEYEFPGYFPGQINRGLCHSESPRNYPLNTNTSMLINTVFGYPVYIAPVALPRKKWLGLGPVLFGMGQALFHGIFVPRRARLAGSGYTFAPGLLSALLLHVPLGLAYIRALREERPVNGSEWAKGVAYMLVIATCASAPIALLRDKHSPDAFTEAQMGPYGGGND